MRHPTNMIASTAAGASQEPQKSTSGSGGDITNVNTTGYYTPPYCDNFFLLNTTLGNEKEKKSPDQVIYA